MNIINTQFYALDPFKFTVIHLQNLEQVKQEFVTRL